MTVVYKAQCPECKYEMYTDGKDAEMRCSRCEVIFKPEKRKKNP